MVRYACVTVYWVFETKSFENSKYEFFKQCTYGFSMILRIKIMISLNIINQMIFIMETRSAFFSAGA
jgi:hypothetical protein